MFSTRASTSCPFSSKDCPSGTYASGGAACLVCQYGQFRDTTTFAGFVAQFNMGEGKGASAYDQPVTKGSQRNQPDLCNPCPENTYLKDDADLQTGHDSHTDCEACTNGRFSSKGSQFCCGNCPAGRVSEKIANKSE